MQTLEDIQKKYFLDCRNLITDLSYTDDLQELIDNKFKIDQLQEKISFLKILSQPENVQFFQPIEEEIISENEVAEEEIVPDEIEIKNEKEPIIEKPVEVISEITEPVKEEPELISEPIEEYSAEIKDEPIETIPEIEEPLAEVQEEVIDKNIEVENFILVSENEIVEDAISEQETVLIVEDSQPISDEKVQEDITQEYFKDEFNNEETHQEKKIRLAHIKGLKPIQSLFDDEFLEEEKPSSVVKSNIPTDYMEAPKPKMEFKLDLNDRIAFTKTLFGGSQTDLNNAVNMLNSFKTLDEAKEYLSDLYYDRNWKKADDYAQRLWNLVENKFL